MNELVEVWRSVWFFKDDIKAIFTGVNLQEIQISK